LQRPSGRPPLALKQLEDENAKLKKLLAEQMLDAAALRELLSKKW
jgi:putative transposase